LQKTNLFVIRFRKIFKAEKTPNPDRLEMENRKKRINYKSMKRTNDLGLNKFKVNGGIHEKSAA
jgi:hypothetical protein